VTVNINKIYQINTKTFENKPQIMSEYALLLEELLLLL